MRRVRDHLRRMRMFIRKNAHIVLNSTALSKIILVYGAPGSGYKTCSSSDSKGLIYVPSLF